MRSYFLDNGLIDKAENSILESVIYYFLLKGRGEEYDIVKQVEAWVRYDLITPNESQYRSHDNMTAVTSWCIDNDREDLINALKILPKYNHPRDIIWLLMCKYKLFRPIGAALLFPILWFMVKNKYKYRPKFTDRIKNFDYFGKFSYADRVNETWVKYYYWNRFTEKYYVVNRTYHVSTERLYWLRKRTGIIWYDTISKMLTIKYNSHNWMKVINLIYDGDVNSPINEELDK